MKLTDKIKEIRKNREFNAQNCLKRQNMFQEKEEKRLMYEKKRLLNEKIEEIKGRITYVVGQSVDQHTVIFQINENEREMYENVKEYFMNIGFKVVIMKIDEFGEDVIVISWKQQSW